jgi:transposase
MPTRERQRDAEDAHLRATAAELRALVAKLRRTIDEQQAAIDRPTRLAFGRTSERVAGATLAAAESEASDNGMSFGPPAAPEPPTSASARATRRSRHGRRRPSTELPVGRVVIDPSDAEKACPCCGAVRVRAGLGGPSRRHDYRPAAVLIRETVRVSHACRRCEQAGGDPQFVRPPLPAEPLPRSSTTSGLLAHVVVPKFVDHLPLCRQESILARHAFAVSRSTPCDRLRGCAALLAPVYRAMLSRVKQSYAVHVDDTPVSLLAPRRGGYAWVAVGDAANPFVVPDPTAGRGRGRPTAWLAGFTGFVHADAYAGYNAVHGGARHTGCWMDARRGFYDVRDQDPRAAGAPAFIRALYAVGRDAAERGVSDNALSRGAGHPAAGRGPEELAVHRRGRRVALGRRPAQRVRQRETSGRGPVGVPSGHPRPRPGPTAGCRRVRPPARPLDA